MSYRRRDPLEAVRRRSPYLRDWAGLPPDVLVLIFNKVGVLDVLCRAEKVCRPWRAMAKNDPVLWRSIDLSHGNLGMYAQDVAKAAVDRADGKLEAFRVGSCCTHSLLEYVGERNKVLRTLCITECTTVYNEMFVEAIKHFPSLEELELSLCKYVYGRKTFEKIGHACPKLKHLRLNSLWYNWASTVDYHYVFKIVDRDEEALAIAKSMPELQHLQLVGNRFTNKGLEAILENCTHLKTLDIRCCFNVSMTAHLQEKCDGIKTLRLPLDSTADYKFESIVQDSEEDYDRDSSCWCCLSCGYLADVERVLYKDVSSDQEFDGSYGFLEFDCEQRDRRAGANREMKMLKTKQGWIKEQIKKGKMENGKRRKNRWAKGKKKKNEKAAKAREEWKLEREAHHLNPRRK